MHTGGSMLDWVPTLPTELLEHVSEALGPADMSAALSVNTAWQRAFGRAVLELRPQGAPPPGRTVRLAERFPGLQRLCLDDCVGALIGDAQAAEAGRLPWLTHLSLSGCRACTDAGLAGLSSLTGLRELSLAQCERLSGHSLAALQSCSRLEKLDMRQGAWLRDRDMPAVCALAGLRALSLVGCKRLTNAGVSQLGVLPQLESLNLSGLDHIDDDGLEALASATTLQELVLDRCNQLRGGALGRLARLPRLRALRMRDCALVSDFSLACLSGAAALQELSLDMCGRITDAGVGHLASLPALQSLSLRECRHVTGSGFAAFAAVEHPLRSLNLSDCVAFSRQGSEAVGALPELAELDVSRCERVDSAMLRALSSLTRLRALRLAGCSCVRDEGLRHLARGCTALESLNLCGCASVRDGGVAALARLPRLNSILLNRCKHVSDTGAAALAAAAELREIALIGTAVSARGLQALADARSLEGRPLASRHLLRMDAHAATPPPGDGWGVVQWAERASLRNQAA